MDVTYGHLISQRKFSTCANSAYQAILSCECVLPGNKAIVTSSSQPPPPPSPQIEGVSYRGRVMVEVETSLGTLPTRNHEVIKLTDRSKVKVRGMWVN